MKRIYTFEEAFEASKKYFNGDELAARVWVDKYALKDKQGNIYESTPTDMHWRIAKELARIEKKYPNPLTVEQLFYLLDKFKYIVPAGSPMFGIGNELSISSLSNCYVVGNEVDSYGGIMQTDEELVQVMKMRGGAGIDISHLRPNGALVNNAASTSSGVVSFMERFSNTTREVSQNKRRGALLESISVYHPDVYEFADSKLDLTKITGANISVRIYDEFMRAVKDNKDFTHKFPVDSDNPEITKTKPAKELWDKIMYNSWKSAEPAILFWSTILKESVADCYADVGYKTVSTNPCQPSWATVLTPDGIKQFKDVSVGDKIWSSEGWTTILRKESSGVKPVYEYRTSLGVFIGTDKHRIVSNGEKIEVRHAKNIDSLVGSLNKDIQSTELIAESKEKAYELQIILSSIGVRSVILNTDDNKYILSIVDSQFKEDIDELNKIYKTELVSTEEVFNITVDNSTHTYWTGGLNVSNCGKLLPQTYSLAA